MTSVCVALHFQKSSQQVMQLVASTSAMLGFASYTDAAA
jgi:hypothetical protein